MKDIFAALVNSRTEHWKSVQSRATDGALLVTACLGDMLQYFATPTEAETGLIKAVECFSVDEPVPFGIGTTPGGHIHVHWVFGRGEALWKRANSFYNCQIFDAMGRSMKALASEYEQTGVPSSERAAWHDMRALFMRLDDLIGPLFPEQDRLDTIINRSPDRVYLVDVHAQ